MLLGSSLVVVVVMVMSVVVVVVSMGMPMAVIVRSSAVVVSCGGRTTAGRGVLLWVARTAVGAHFGAGGRRCKRDVIVFSIFLFYFGVQERNL